MLFTEQELSKFEKFHTCLWLYNRSARKMEWANQKAVKLFGFDSLEDLQSQSLENIEELAESRLEDYSLLKKTRD